MNANRLLAIAALILAIIALVIGPTPLVSPVLLLLLAVICLSAAHIL